MTRSLDVQVLKFRLVVFDLDGTLVDSLRDLADAANQVLQENGGEPHSEDAIGQMVGDGAATLVARVFAAAGRPPPPESLARFLAIYNGRLLNFTRAYAGIPELLDQLEGTTLAVLTNKPLGATMAILEGLSLASYFGARVIGGDGPFPRKPLPAGLEHLMERAGTTADATLMVGDSVVDWRTARAVGANCCIARYGFGFHEFPVAELGDRDHCIDHPLELARWLLPLSSS